MEGIRQMLMEAIFEVFEKMLFIFLEPSDEPESRFEMESVIQYDGGGVKGNVRMLLPQVMASTMAQNLLGIYEKDVKAKQQEDCAKEAVNMVCGNFLSKFDPGRVFHLSIPELESTAGATSPAGEGVYRLDFDSDQGKLSVVLTMSGK